MSPTPSRLLLVLAFGAQLVLFVISLTLPAGDFSDFCRTEGGSTRPGFLLFLGGPQALLGLNLGAVPWLANGLGLGAALLLGLGRPRAAAGVSALTVGLALSFVWVGRAFPIGDGTCLTRLDAPLIGYWLWVGVFGVGLVAAGFRVIRAQPTSA